MNTSRVTVPSTWQDLAEAIGNAPGTVLVLGDADTGKSTLVQFLAGRCHKMGLRTAVVDSDLGQSLLGLPATVSSAPIVSAQWWSAPCPFFRFVGAVSPQGHADRFIASLGRVMDRVRKMGSQAILVDTTGFIHGCEAGQLKHRKMELLQPAHVVALQRADEVEHILADRSEAPHALIHRLTVCDDVRKRSQQERRRSREGKFKRYFAKARPLEVDTTCVALSGTWLQSGQQIPARAFDRLSAILGAQVLYGERTVHEVVLILAGRASTVHRSELHAFLNADSVQTVSIRSFAHCLVGLCDERGESLALGIVKELVPQANRLLVHTPLASACSVQRVEFGFLKLRLSGQEWSQR